MSETTQRTADRIQDVAIRLGGAFAALRSDSSAWSPSQEFIASEIHLIIKDALDAQAAKHAEEIAVLTADAEGYRLAAEAWTEHGCACDWEAEGGSDVRTTAPEESCTYHAGVTAERDRLREEIAAMKRDEHKHANELREEVEKLGALGALVADLVEVLAALVKSPFDGPVLVEDYERARAALKEYAEQGIKP